MVLYICYTYQKCTVWLVNTRDNDNGISFVHSLDTEYAIFLPVYLQNSQSISNNMLLLLLLFLHSDWKCRNIFRVTMHARERGCTPCHTRGNRMYTWNDANDKKHITGYGERGFFFSLWQIDDSDGNMYAHFKTILKRKHFGIFITFSKWEHVIQHLSTHKTLHYKFDENLVFIWETIHILIRDTIIICWK